MLILMSMFLVMVVYHARLIEVTSRLDFLWKLQAETDLDEMEDTQKTNKHLLKHILPDHVVNHFLSKESAPDVSFSIHLLQHRPVIYWCWVLKPPSQRPISIFFKKSNNPYNIDGPYHAK